MIICTYKILVGRYEGKRPLGRHPYRHTDRTYIRPKIIGWGSVDRSCMAQGRDQWWALVKHSDEHSNFKKFGELLTCRMTLRFSSWTLLQGSTDGQAHFVHAQNCVPTQNRQVNNNSTIKYIFCKVMETKCYFLYENNFYHISPTERKHSST